MSGLKFDISGITKGLAEFDAKAKAVSKIYAETAGEKMVADAKLKKNAKWEDGTGNSRQTMDKNIVIKGNTTQIQLRGNTSHFKYLELCHEKKWAVLWPTIQKWSGEVLKGWAKVIWK